MLIKQFTKNKLVEFIANLPSFTMAMKRIVEQIFGQDKFSHTTELLLLLLKIVKQHYKNLMLLRIPAGKIEDLK